MKRILAFITDIAMIKIFVICIKMFFQITAEIQDIIFVVLFSAYYFIVLIAFNGQTVGNKLLGIKCVQLNKRNLVVRCILYIIMISPFFLIFTDIKLSIDRGYASYINPQNVMITIYMLYNIISKKAMFDVVCGFKFI